MKGPSLRYDLRVLRVFHCDACGREAQAPGNATSHTCPCSDPPKFMRPLERPRTVSPDVSRFISPAEPEDSIEEVEISDEDYVPHVPQLPPRPERFPNRRKLSDDIEKYQGADSVAGGDAAPNMDRAQRSGDPVGGRGPDREPHRHEPRRDRQQSGDRSGPRPAQDNRDRRERGNNQLSGNERGDRGRPSGSDSARRDRSNDRTSDRPQERGDRGPRNGPSQGRGGRGPGADNSQNAQPSVADSLTNPAETHRPNVQEAGKNVTSGSPRSRGPRPETGRLSKPDERESQEEFGSGLEPVGVNIGNSGRNVGPVPNGGEADGEMDSEDIDGEAEESAGVSADGRPPRRRNRRRGRRRGRGQSAGAEGAASDSQSSSGNASSEGNASSNPASDG